MRVISVLRSNHQYDVSGAAKLGSVHYLLDGEKTNLFNPSEYVQHLLVALERTKYHPDEDLLMMTGSPIAISLLLSTVLCVHGRARILLFDSRANRYIERKLTAAEKVKS